MVKEEARSASRLWQGGLWATAWVEVLRLYFHGEWHPTLLSIRQRMCRRCGVQTPYIQLWLHSPVILRVRTQHPRGPGTRSYGDGALHLLPPCLLLPTLCCWTWGLPSVTTGMTPSPSQVVTASAVMSRCGGGVHQCLAAGHGPY